MEERKPFTNRRYSYSGHLSSRIVYLVSSGLFCTVMLGGSRRSRSSCWEVQTAQRWSIVLRYAVQWFAPRYPVDHEGVWSRCAVLLTGMASHTLVWRTLAAVTESMQRKT